MMACIKEGTR